MVNSTPVDTIHVNSVTGNDTNTGSRLSPLKSLCYALKLAQQVPAIIQLASGTYSTANGEVFPIVIPGGVLVVGNEANKGKEIVISGGGEYHSPSFGIQNITLLLLGDASVLGVTVTNSTVKGTGIWIESTTPTLVNNTLATCGREGIFTTGNATLTILDNLFVQNSASGLFMARHSRGDVLRNVFIGNHFGIVISDFATPLVANNKLSENHTAIALSRHARPVFRQNLITRNTQIGLLVNGNAVPDLGEPQSPGGNIFLDQGELDLQNLTSQKLISIGNQLNPNRVRGHLELISPDVPYFTDIEGHWAEAFIRSLERMKLTQSFTDGTYQPDEPMTRAQYAALVGAAFNPAPKRSTPKFIDVPQDFWAAEAIKVAASGGFVGGFSDSTFRPEQNVQRLQVIVSLVNGLGLVAANQDVLLTYEDIQAIPEYARTAIATATQQKIIVNYPNSKLLAPMREATRAEAAAMVYQALVAIQRASAINSPYIVLHITN